MEKSNLNRSVTMDDVIGALAGTDPFLTNASKIRDVLGRGSFATIQKHLNSLREAATSSQNSFPMAEVPNAPRDVLEGLWNAAYNAAGFQVLGKMAEVMTSRDSFQAAHAASVNDLTTLAVRVDELEAAVVSAEAAAKIAAGDCEQALIALAEQQREADARITALTAEADVALNQAAHFLELEQRDRIIERQTLQAAMSSLTDQIGELKALLTLQARP